MKRNHLSFKLACWGIALFFIPFVFGHCSFAQKVGSFTEKVIYNGDTCVLSYFVPYHYNPANKYKLIVAVDGITIDSVSSSPFFLNSIIVNPNIPGSTPPPADTSYITVAIHSAMTSYNINRDYLYITGGSWGGRYALWYGLINWKRFRGIYADDPDFLLRDFGTKRVEDYVTQVIHGKVDTTEILYVPEYSYKYAQYIPIIIRVGSNEACSAGNCLIADSADAPGDYRTFEPSLYRRFVDSSALVNFAVEYGEAHTAVLAEMEFRGYQLLDKLASSCHSDDAGILALTIPTEECSASYKPLLTIQNKGIGTLSKAYVYYQLDGGAPTQLSWSGTMLRLQKDTFSLPLLNLHTGSHTLKAYTSMPNGVNDSVPSNDTVVVTFNTISAGHGINVSEGFEETAFPPQGWTLVGDGYFNWNKVDSSAFGWTEIPKQLGTNLFGSYSKSASAIYFDNACGNNTGKRYSIRSPQYDFSNVTAPRLSFDYAYGLKGGVVNYTDTLAIYYSKNCGVSWSLLVKKTGTNLETIKNQNVNSYGTLYPNSPPNNYWNSDTLQIDSVIGQSEVIFSFENISGHGGLLYLDNISINGALTTGIPAQKQESVSFEVYPNPSNGSFSVNIHSAVQSACCLEVTNTLGQLIYNERLPEFSGEFTRQMNLGNSGKGVYFISVKTQHSETVNKIIVN